MRILPVLDEGGGSTSLQAFNNCLALLPRRSLIASLVYLPALLAVMAFDRQGHY